MYIYIYVYIYIYIYLYIYICFSIRSRRCVAAFFLQVPKLCLDLDPTFLYILMSKTYSSLVWENELPALASSSHAQALAACLPRQDHVWILSDELIRMHKMHSTKCLANWTRIPLKIRARSRNTPPCRNEINLRFLLFRKVLKKKRAASALALRLLSRSVLKNC